MVPFNDNLLWYVSLSRDKIVQATSCSALRLPASASCEVALEETRQGKKDMFELHVWLMIKAKNIVLLKLTAVYK